MKPGRTDEDVLIVEDDQPIRELLAATFRRQELSVLTAQDGAEGIALLAAGKFRVLVLDLMMPRVSGWEVIDWLRDDLHRKPRTVIVVSAADRSILQELEPAVVNAIVFKPFDAYELSNYVAACATNDFDRDLRVRRIVGGA